MPGIKGIVIRTPRSIMRVYECDYDTAERYCDLRDEGHSVFQARIMAGLADPPEGDFEAVPNPEAVAND